MRSVKGFSSILIIKVRKWELDSTSKRRLSKNDYGNSFTAGISRHMNGKTSVKSSNNFVHGIQAKKRNDISSTGYRAA